MDNQKHTPEQFIRENYGVTKWDLIYTPDFVTLLMDSYSKELLQENERLKKDNESLRNLSDNELISDQAKRIEELETKNKNQADLIERCIHPDRLPEHVKKLEGLLHKILKESVGGNVPFSFELYNEIKAALNL